MSQRAQDLAQRIESFRDDVVAYVETFSDEDWNKLCEWEDWGAGVTARHIGASHFGVAGLLEMIIQGKELPQLTLDDINAASDKDSREHADCTKDEALETLRKNGTDFAAFVAGLSDDDLDSKGSMPAFGGEVSVNQIIEFVIFHSAKEHLDNLKTAVGK